MGKLKKPRFGPPSEPTMDVLFYNQILDVLRHQQDLGVAYYGNFVYEAKPVPAELYGQWHAPLLPHIQRKVEGSQMMQSQKSGLGLGLGLSGSASKGGKRLTMDGASGTPGQSPGLGRPGAGLGRPTQGGALQGSGQRLGSLSQGGGYTPGGRPGRSDGGFGSGTAAGSLGRNDDFPAARIAADFVQRHKELYGQTGGPDDWKQIMMDLLEQKGNVQPHEDKAGPFTEEEDAMILVARSVYGNKWSLVDKIIPGRGAGAIKKHWHSTLRDRYKRARWCLKLLAPPDEVYQNAQARLLEDDRDRSQSGGSNLLAPGPPQVVSTVKTPDAAWWLGGARALSGRQGAEETGGDEDEQASLQADATELEAARASKDPALYKRVLHTQYLRHMAACERSCRADGVWEDVCFVCKTAEKPVAKCQWGRNGVGGAEAAQTPCVKACHSRCLPAGRPPPIWQFWMCPRHQCAVPSCNRSIPTNICRSCPNAYCASHLPPGSKDAEPLFQALPPGAPTYRKVICPNCQEVERTPNPWPSATRANQTVTPGQSARQQPPPQPAHPQLLQHQDPRTQPSLSPSLQPLQSQQQQQTHQQQMPTEMLQGTSQVQTPQPTATLQLALQGPPGSAPAGRPSSTQRVNQRQLRQQQQQEALQRLEEAPASNGEAPWMRLVESIRPLPTNNGGPTVDRIKRAMEMLKGEETMNDIRDILEASISPGVYKSNSAGATKNMALAAVEKARRRLAGVPEGPAVSAFMEGGGRGRKQPS